MSPVAVLQVDARVDKSPIFGDKSTELNIFNSFDKSNVPATCRTRVSSVADDTLTTCRLRLVAFDILSTCRTSPIQATCSQCVIGLRILRPTPHKIGISEQRCTQDFIFFWGGVDFIEEVVGGINLTEV